MPNASPELVPVLSAQHYYDEHVKVFLSFVEQNSDGSYHKPSWYMERYGRLKLLARDLTYCLVVHGDGSVSRDGWMYDEKSRIRTQEASGMYKTLNKVGKRYKKEQESLGIHDDPSLKTLVAVLNAVNADSFVINDDFYGSLDAIGKARIPTVFVTDEARQLVEQIRKENS